MFPKTINIVISNPGVEEKLTLLLDSNQRMVRSQAILIQEIKLLVSQVDALSSLVRSLLPDRRGVKWATIGTPTLENINNAPLNHPR